MGRQSGRNEWVVFKGTGAATQKKHETVVPLLAVPADQTSPNRPSTRLIVLGQIADVLSGTRSDQGLRQALEILRGATDADDLELFVKDPELNRLVLSSCVGPDQQLLQERTEFMLGQGVPGIVAHSARPLVLHDLGQDPRYLRKSVARAGLQVCIGVPICSAVGVVGSLHALWRGPVRSPEIVAQLLADGGRLCGMGIEAALAQRRQLVEQHFDRGERHVSDAALLLALTEIQAAAGAQAATLAIHDGRTGRPARVISTTGVNLLCACAATGQLAPNCELLQRAPVLRLGARRFWPQTCRSIPVRARQICELPLIAGDVYYGQVVLDLGRTLSAERLAFEQIALQVMARRILHAIQPQHEGIPLSTMYCPEDVTVASTPGPTLEFRCLGPFQILRGGVPVAAEAFTRSKALELLKMLLVKGGDSLHRDVLVEQLWPGVEPQAGANRLHGVVHALRAVLEPHAEERRWLYVRNHRELYYLNLGALATIDLLLFERDLREASLLADTDPEQAVVLLERATALYRGELFAEDRYASWCEDERREYHRRHQDGLTLLARLHRQQGDRTRGVEILRRALLFAPCDEALHQALISELIDLGHRREALAQYEACVAILSTELDAQPLPSTRGLLARIGGKGR
jgi:DNA-binding SARP family transcriptional activator